MGNNKVYTFDDIALKWEEIISLQDTIFAKVINNDIYFIKEEIATGKPIQLIKTNDFVVYETFDMFFEDVGPNSYNRNVSYNMKDTDGGSIYNAFDTTLDNSTYNETIINYGVYDLIYVNGFYYLTGYNIDSNMYYYRSADLKTWEIKPFLYAGTYKSLLYGNDVFITQSSEAPGYTINSINGEIWENSQINLNGRNTKYTTGIFYDITADGKFRYFTENDVSKLKDINLGLSGILPESIYFINNKFYFLRKDVNGLYLYNIAGSNYSDIFNIHKNNVDIHLSAVERDTFNSKLGTQELAEKINKFHYDNQEYTGTSINNLNLGSLENDINALNDEIEVHKDDLKIHADMVVGEAWNIINFPIEGAVNTVAYGNGIYVATGNTNRLLTSVDCINWTIHPTFTAGIYNLKFFNGIFIGTGSYGAPGLIFISSNGIDWTQYSLGETIYLSSIIYGNGIYLIKGGSTNIVRSYDGITWSKIVGIPMGYIDEILWADDKFVVIDDNANKVYTSTDTINWTSSSISPLPDYYYLIYGNGKYVLSYQDNIQVSTDLITWTETPLSIDFWTGLYGQGIYYSDKFYAVFEAYSDNWDECTILVTSVDGITWNIEALPVNNTPYEVLRLEDMLLVTSYKRIFMSASGDAKSYWNLKSNNDHPHNNDGRVQIYADRVVSGLVNIDRLPPEVFDRVYTVPSNAARFALTRAQVQTGDSVHVYQAGPESPINEWYRVINDNKLNIEAGYLRYGENADFTTVDFSGVQGEPTTISGYGITDLNNKTETENILNNTKDPTKLMINNKINEFDQNVVVDGFTYEEIYGRINYSFSQLLYQNGQFILFSNDAILVSPDGFTWHKLISNYSMLQVILPYVIYNNGLYILFDYYKKVAVSNDLINWDIKSTIPSTAVLSRMIYGNGVYLVCGDRGEIYTSSDLIIWNRRSGNFPINTFFQDIKFLNNRFFIIEPGISIYTSIDSITWTLISILALTDITYANGIFIAIGLSGKILTSSDGITWFNRISGTNNNLKNITYANGMFIIVGDNGTILTSNDGITWIFGNNDGITKNFNNIIYGNDMFLISSTDTVLTSSNGLNWKKVFYTSETIFPDYDDDTVWQSYDGITWNIYPEFALSPYFVLFDNNNESFYLMTITTPVTIAKISNDFKHIIPTSNERFKTHQSKLLSTIETSKNVIELF